MCGVDSSTKELFRYVVRNLAFLGIIILSRVRQAKKKLILFCNSSLAVQFVRSPPYYGSFLSAAPARGACLWRVL